MSDQDFNFSPPPPRRERKEFEPPPWEKDLFDRIAKERKAETVPTESVAEPERSLVVEGQEITQEQVTVDAHPPSDEGVSKASPELDEVQLAAMMFELRAEEAPATQMYERVSLAAGVILLFIGLVILIWSVVMIAVALRQPEQGRSGVYVGMTVLVFGAGLVGTGAWFVFKTLRQQGVL